MRVVGWRWVGGALVALLGIAGSASNARANGFDVPDIGARGLGRGGALMARVDDPLAIYYNPAALSLLPNPQLMLGTHFGFLSFCADRAGFYTDGSDGIPGRSWTENAMFPTVFDRDPNLPGSWASDPTPIEYPEVCQDGPLGVSPHLMFGMPIGDRMGFGIGVMAPSAAGHLTWSDTDEDPSRFGTIPDPTGRTANGRLPAPTRYGLVEAFPILLFPTVSFAWSPHHMLRVGVSAQWGMAIVKFLNITRADGGGDVGGDIYTELNATDLFVPSVIASVMFTPLDNGRHLFDSVLWFRYTDSVRASGDLDLRPYYYQSPRMLDPATGQPYQRTFRDTEIDAPQTAEIRLALRYASRISARPRRRSEMTQLTGRTEDNMVNERFDIELDAAYELTSMVDRFVVTVTETDRFLPGVTTLPRTLDIPHNWRNTLSLRLGSDWNVLPGLASLRAGVSWEQGAMPDEHLVLDFPALQRFGVHAGLTVRYGKFDVSLAYAHFFMVSQEASCEREEPLGCTGGESDARQTVANPPGDIVGAGRLTASLHMLSLGVTYNFR